jgi:hypothetical protein
VVERVFRFSFVGHEAPQLVQTRLSGAQIPQHQNSASPQIRTDLWCR